MKLGIMQPYFFPYLGYFDLIRRVDQWVVFDTAQYIRHGWVNRNRILHPHGGWQYVIAPIKKGPQEIPIHRVELADPAGLQARISGQLQHYRKRAPYYAPVIYMVAECLEKPPVDLARLNVSILTKVCAYLQIPFHYTLFSEWNKPLGPIRRPGDWALEISRAMGASEYVNPPGGADLFDRARFEEARIKLTIQELVDFRYECGGYEFVSCLSIIDVLMWNHPLEVKMFLHHPSGESRLN